MKKTLIITALLCIHWTLNYYIIMIPTKDEHKTINQLLLESGIDNSKVRLAIIALIGTEGGYKCKQELSYRNTGTTRLRQIFGSRLSAYSDQQLDVLKAQDIDFYDVIYGNKYGNDKTGDGWKFRARGYNGITFKSNYERYGQMIGVDLVNNPELLSTPAIAGKVLAAYFIDLHEIGIRSGQIRRKFNVSHWNQLSKQSDINKLVCQMNAGWGTNITRGIFPEKLAKIENIATDIISKYNHI